MVYGYRPLYQLDTPKRNPRALAQWLILRVIIEISFNYRFSKYSKTLCC